MFLQSPFGEAHAGYLMDVNVSFGPMFCLLKIAWCCWFLKTNLKKLKETGRGPVSPWRRSSAWKRDSAMRV